MSAQDNTPTAEQIREARHAGFDNSVSGMPDDRLQRLTDAHRTQDARREKNITEFYGNVLGGDE